jgi:hypothetical protein
MIRQRMGCPGPGRMMGLSGMGTGLRRANLGQEQSR